LDAKSVPLKSGNFGDFGENDKFLSEGWRFNLEDKSGPLASGDFCEIGDFGENGKIWQKWRKSQRTGEIQNMANTQIGRQVAP